MGKMDELFDGSDAHLMLHTTTPWSFQECGSDPALYQLLDAAGKVIGFPRRGTGGNAEKRDCLQNARLISAAPDMLAVLLELRDSASYWSEYDVPLGIVERIDSAIAKALHAPANP